MNYNIYAYFNATEIKTVLNSIVMLMGSGGVDGDYLALIRIAGMLGLLIAIAVGFVRARGEDAGMYLIVMALFYGTLFVPRVTVTIEDKSGIGGAPLTVANVPLGLAVITSSTSQIGYWLTDRMETFFSLPDEEMKVSRGGLMSMSRTLREAHSASIPDPVLTQDLIMFMKECINPELLNSPTALKGLINSTDIWTSIKNDGLLNPGRVVALTGVATYLQCDAAYDKLQIYMTPLISSEFERISRMLSPNLGVTDAKAVLMSMLPNSESMFMTASSSALDSIKQRAMINLMNESSGTLAQIQSDPASAQIAMGASVATASANSSYILLAKVAQEILPIIRNAIELVLIGTFPIILILIIVAGTKGGVLLRSYIMATLWVQLWAPLYAIVNFVTTMAGAKSMRASLGGYDGINIANAAAFLNTTFSVEALAGILTISVPLIALALIKGGEVAMSGVVQGMLGPSNSAASQAGAQAAQGNFSVGNTSWGNSSSHNTTRYGFSETARISSGNTASYTDAFGSLSSANSSTGTHTVANIASSNIPQGSVSSQQVLSRGDSVGNTSQASISSGIMDNFTSGKTSIQNQQQATQIGNAIQMGVTRQGGTTETSGATDLINKAIQSNSGINLSDQNALSTGNTLQGGLSGKVGAGLGGGGGGGGLPVSGSVGLSGSANRNSSGTEQKAVGRQTGSSEGTSKSNSFNVAKQALLDARASVSDSGSKQYVDSLVATLNEMEASSMTSSNSAQKQETASQGTDEKRSNSITATRDHSQPFFAWATTPKEQGGGGLQPHEFLQHAGRQDQKFVGLQEDYAKATSGQAIPKSEPIMAIDGKTIAPVTQTPEALYEQGKNKTIASNNANQERVESNHASKQQQVAEKFDTTPTPKPSGHDSTFQGAANEIGGAKQKVDQYWQSPEGKSQGNKLVSDLAAHDFIANEANWGGFGSVISSALGIDDNLKEKGAGAVSEKFQAVLNDPSNAEAQQISRAVTEHIQTHGTTDGLNIPEITKGIVASARAHNPDDSTLPYTGLYDRATHGIATNINRLIGDSNIDGAKPAANSPSNSWRGQVTRD